MVGIGPRTFCMASALPLNVFPTCFSLQIKEGLLATRDKLKIGDVEYTDSFAGAVIDKKAFDRITGYIKHAKSSPNLEIIGGGQYDER
jgi:NAD-dependent aldehyde dehydrogenases